jgi:hypothetical protein
MSVTKYINGSSLLLRQFLHSHRERIDHRLVGDIDNTLHPTPDPLRTTGFQAFRSKILDDKAATKGYAIQPVIAQHS